MGYSEALEKQLQTARHLDYFFARRRKRVDSLVMRAVAGAEPFYVAPDITDLLVSVAATIPDYTLTSEDLFVDWGFIYFDKAIGFMPPVQGYSDAPQPLQAISFSWPRERQDIAVDLHYGIGDVKTYGYISFSWKFGTSISTWLEQIPPTTWLDRAVPDGGLDLGSLYSTVLTVFAAFLTFIKQRLLVSSRDAADRGTRRRFERELTVTAPLVGIVQLRKREYAGHADTGDHEAREYACQWVVRGHWRQQWYAKRAIHQPKWIAPHIKGPEDKPLKPPRATVFAVVR